VVSFTVFGISVLTGKSTKIIYFISVTASVMNDVQFYPG